jgi:hypothetical protein
MKFKKILLLWNYSANLNETLMKWSLGGFLPKLCPAFQTSDEDGRNSRLEDGTTGHIFGRGPSKDHSTKVWLQLAQWFRKRRYLCEFPIGSYVKLSSAVGSILVEGLNRRTRFSTWTIQGLFHQNLVLIEQMVWDKKILKIEKGVMKFKKNLLLWNYSANLNETLLRWSLGGPLPQLNPAFQTSDRDGRHSRT